MLALHEIHTAFLCTFSADYIPLSTVARESGGIHGDGAAAPGRDACFPGITEAVADTHTGTDEGIWQDTPDGALTLYGE